MSGDPGASTPTGDARRAHLLDAALAVLAERGHQGVTMQDIARRANVSKALVHHYFGTRSGVLAAAMDDISRVLLPVDDPSPGGGPPPTGEELLRTFITRWESAERCRAVIAVIRSSITHGEAAELLDCLLRPDRLGLAEGPSGAVGGCEHTLMIAAQLLGLMVARHIVPVEPIASAGVDQLVAAFGPVVQRCLTEHASGGCGTRRS